MDYSRSTTFLHKDKQKSDLIRSTDWNDMGNEINRLEDAKLDRSGDVVSGDLTIAESGELKTNSNTYLAMSDGNVGIKEKNPETELAVKGTISASGDIFAGFNGNGTIHSRHIDGKQQDNNSADTLHLQYDTGLKVSVNRPDKKGGLDVHGNISSDYLSVRPQNNDTEGGELRLEGTGGSSNIHIDNYDGNCRVHTLKPGKQFQVIGGGALLQGALSIKTGTDNALNLQTTDNKWLYTNFIDKDNIRRTWMGLDDNLDTFRIHTENNTGKIALTGGDVGIGTASPKATLDVNGTVRAKHIFATDPMHQRMYPGDSIVHQDIFEALKKGAIKKMGNPGYDDTSYRTNPWNKRRIIRFGNDNQQDGHGALVTVPNGYNTLWVRVLGDRWTVFKAYFTDGKKENIGLWAGGYRANNCYCPDGSLSDGYYNPHDGHTRTLHEWVPVPVNRSGNVALVAKPHTGSHFWISGIGFSKNPWNHTAIHAVNVHWALNGGTGVDWYSHNWNDDVLARILANSNYTMKIPVIENGKDKLIYMSEHNNHWNGCMFEGITVNGKPIERFISTYDNPFARHWNSKFYQRYIAARIPAGHIKKNSRWIDVKIDMSKQAGHLHFREMGTHDYELYS